MARPKKEEGASNANHKDIRINHGACLQMLNFLASSLQSQHENATRQVSLASDHMNKAQRSLDILKNQAHVITNGNDIPLESLITEHPHLHRLLSAKSAEHTANADLPEAQAPSEAKPAKLKKQRKERDPNAPKRPLTAFFLFLQDKRDETTEAMKKSDPGFKPGDVQKRNTERWNALPEHEQEPYKKRYEANLEKYKQDLKAYKGEDAVIPDEIHGEEPVEADPLQDAPLVPQDSTNEDEGEESEQEPTAKPEVQESSSESDESEEESPPPKKESKKVAGKAVKEASPEKKKKAAVVKDDKKQSKKAKEPTKSASPEVSKRKRKAEEKEVVKPEKKKKPRKSQGYNGNDEDF